MKTGKIIQVMGPVVDVEFEDENLPAIRDALEVLNGDKKSVMEVAQHIGNNTVRCIMLASSEGLHRDMEVTATGAGIKTPVGEQTLGRLFNVLGEAIDGGAQPDTEEKWEIHREPPTFEEQTLQRKSSRQVSRSSTSLPHMQRVEKSDSSEEPE